MILSQKEFNKRSGELLDFIFEEAKKVKPCPKRLSARKEFMEWACTEEGRKEFPQPSEYYELCEFELKYGWHGDYLKPEQVRELKAKYESEEK